MSIFWETMNAATDAARETLGEPILLNGEETTAIVDQSSYEDTVAAGGRKTIINCRILVGAAESLYDGMPVTVRGAEGKVGSWERIAPDGSRWVNIGSRNRWSGEVPGV